MAQITQVATTRMHEGMAFAYERFLATMGTPEFGSTVRDCILEQTAGASRVYLFEATDRANSDLQYSFCEPAVKSLLAAYRERYLCLDPVWDAYKAARRRGDMAVLRVRPADIASASFRRQFFDEPGIAERVSIIQRGDDAWRVINVARHRDIGLFSDREIQNLAAIARVALPMLPHNRRRSAPARPLSVSQIEDRFAALFPALTTRERQVCARAAIGMSVEATALDLSIARTSVLTYRRRAYGRLNISSPFELSALVNR